MTSPSWLRAALLAAWVCGAAACPGQLADPERFFADGGGATGATPPAPCPDVESQLFATTCALSGCHAAASKTAGLDLESPMVAMRLRDVPATGGPGLLIDSHAPEASVVLTKLSGAPPFGASMPPTGMLAPTTLSCVHDWVLAATR